MAEHGPPRDAGVREARDRVRSAGSGVSVNAQMDVGMLRAHVLAAASHSL